MARFGIDFGTTNTIAVLHDRGLFSEVQHSAETGAGTIVNPLFPSAILVDQRTGERHYGLEADRLFGRHGPADHFAFIPSLKRWLRDYSEGPEAARVRDEGQVETGYDMAELLRGFLQAFADSVRCSPSLTARADSGEVAPEEVMEAVITWPANSNGAQRHLTRRCFREAGFSIIDSLNEPTSSAIELANCLAARQVKRPFRKPSAVVVFDLGGGTFDAAVVWVEGDDFNVLASGGIEHLGGDDLDEMLLGMFLEALRAPIGEITGLTRHALLRQVRAQKETISTGIVKRMFLNPMDFGLRSRSVSVTVEAFYEHIRPFLRPAVELLHRVIARAAEKEPRITSSGEPLLIYLVGGSSKLPLVAEMVAGAFPEHRVILSDKPFISVAMGAAICAADKVNVREVFGRHFGLIRLRDHGLAECFDPIFPAGTPLPRRGEPPLERVAWYAPRHNIGHLRYLECTEISIGGLPEGDIRNWSDIRFPYDPAVPLSGPALEGDIRPTDAFASSSVCEVYRCDSDGVITVELRRPHRNDARTYEIYRD